MQVILLGPVRLTAEDGTPVDIGGVRLRMLLARLALAAGRPVTSEALTDGLWGAELPSDSANALQSLVSRLRKVVGTGIESTTGGYRLDLPAEKVDAHRFETLAARGKRELTAGRAAEAAAVLAEALALWRGDALADVADAPFARAPITRLTELRDTATEDLFDARLQLGAHAEILADLETASAAHPLRERLAGLRMRALSSAGRQSEALAVYETLRATLADELGVDPSAELQQTHLAVLRGEVTAPAKAADHLPTRLTSFVGREDELKLLTELLSGSRLVTLVGPGGAGKTRLATETVAKHPANARGRVWFAPLAGVRDPADVADAVLAALGLWDIRIASETRKPPKDPAKRIVEALSGGDCVLVLDNCEHLIDAAARFADQLLGRVPGLRILATSREPLAIEGETLCSLGPLAVPGDRLTVAEATELSAVRLFVDRARSVRPGFELTESTVDAVAEICRRLDGMPLALELAAARLRSMTVDQIAQRLDDRFRLLTSGSRAALPRQRTLRAVVEWSWDLLDDAERTLARRLSLFGAGAGLAAIEAVCAGDSLLAEDCVYVVGSLVEKSIVDAYVADNGDPRYRMLETIRAYAGERLAEADEVEQTWSAFTTYHAELACEIEPKVRTADQLSAIAVYDVEQDNIMAALRHAIDTADAPRACDLSVSMFWFWILRGHNERALSTMSELLPLRDGMPRDAAASISAFHAMNLSIPIVPDGLDVRAIIDECVDSGAYARFPGLSIALPMLAFFTHDLDLAMREVKRSIGSDDPWARAAGHWMESFILNDRGDVEGGYRAQTRALELFQEIGDRWGTAMTLGMRAEALSQAGDGAGAIQIYEQGLALALELNSDDDIIQQRWRLALERARAGDHDGAWHEVRGAEAVAERSGNLQLNLMASFGRAELLLMTRDLEAVRVEIQRFKEVESLLPFPGEIGDEWLAALEARVAVLEEDWDTVEDRLRKVCRSTVDRHDMPDLARAVEVLAQLRFGRRDAAASATALGVSEVIRGRFDFGNPQLRALVPQLEAELGAAGYAEHYRLGSALSKPDAVDWTIRQTGA
ncbi:BTAD domain-containing putative transcriptional regulator [Amycolatopsis sp. cg5]|uniref:ATP-binding protein n=1 Tax=Amycolatopsis sp. cg5 TaxID=3238802 RepID=UPI00352588DC